MFIGNTAKKRAMSGYKIRILDEAESDTWDDFIDRCEGGTIFHKFAWLKAAGKHTKFSLIPLVVFKGDSLICAFPFFTKKNFSLKVILSPPNGCGIPYLGPVLALPASNQYKLEKFYFGLVDAIINFLKKVIGFDYIRIVLTPYISDTRPFIWNGLNVRPNYTYIISLKDDINIIFNNFDGRIRTMIRKFEKNKDCNIQKGDFEDFFKLLNIVQRRYKLQGIKYKVSKKYLSDLLDSNLSESFMFLGAFRNEELITGNILLRYKNNLHHWIGGVKVNENIAGINESIHWSAIKEHSQINLNHYELIGANTRHLCDHKSKYSPKLLPFYTVEGSTWKGRLGLGVFKKLSGRK